LDNVCSRPLHRPGIPALCVQPLFGQWATSPELRASPQAAHLRARLPAVKGPAIGYRQRSKRACAVTTDLLAYRPTPTSLQGQHTIVHTLPTPRSTCLLTNAVFLFPPPIWQPPLAVARGARYRIQWSLFLGWSSETGLCLCDYYIVLRREEGDISYFSGASCIPLRKRMSPMLLCYSACDLVQRPCPAPPHSKDLSSQ
jgi:hypothetical protein